jgi:DNA-binding NarL/FixJ family response regulator
MNKTVPFRVLIADDHAIIRQGLTDILSQEEDICVVAEATNGQEAIELFRRHRPSLVLMDIRMPKVNGTAATRAICTEFPTASILIFSLCEGPEVLIALQAGAKGSVRKDAHCDELIAAIRVMATQEPAEQPAI